MDIVIKGLTKSFDGRRVLDGFDAVFPDGQITCLMGDSGCGKTTLLNILLGFSEPDAGVIEGMPGKVGVVFQEDRLCEDFSAASNIMLATGRRYSKSEIYRFLEKLGLSGIEGQPVREFSGGMKRLVAIARALLFDCDLIVLDEAFKGLDEDTKELVLDCAREYCAGKTVVSVTHDPNEAQKFGDLIIRMEKK